MYQVTQRGYALIAAGPLPETAGPDGTKFHLGWVRVVCLCSTCLSTSNSEPCSYTASSHHQVQN